MGEQGADDWLASASAMLTAGPHPCGLVGPGFRRGGVLTLCQVLYPPHFWLAGTLCIPGRVHERATNSPLPYVHRLELQLWQALEQCNRAPARGRPGKADRTS